MTLKENHNIEFKQSWQEKNMDTICAFANTNGGSMFVGKDDSGIVKGIENAKSLMDEIPNKITSILGFSPDVRLKKEKENEFIEIIVKPQNYAVSLRGKYYFRSGSSTHELKGAQLQNFLLNKSNQDWESLIEEEATLKDIDAITIKRFQELSVKRFPSASNENEVEDLLEKLNLIQKGKLTKASILLFGKNPQKFYKNAQFKIGVFANDTDLKNTDIVEGNLFLQIEKIFDLLKNKYLVYHSSIEGIYRTEELEYPEAALREAIINAIVHRDYIGAHTQLSIFPNKLSLWNYGELPSELTFERLKASHHSLPRNSRIADVFYKAGLIESWGTGTIKIIKALKEVGLPEPSYESIDGGFSLTMFKDIYTEQLLSKAGLNSRQIMAISYMKEFGTIGRTKYEEITNIRKSVAATDIQDLVDKKLLNRLGTTGRGTKYELKQNVRKTSETSGKEILNSNVRKTSETSEIQRGRKGAKTTLKGPNDLDAQLSLLKEKLSSTNSKNEIKSHFSATLFFQIYDNWIASLLKKVITVGQKFNDFYTAPQHYISITHGGIGTKFLDENPNDIVEEFRKNTFLKKDNISSDSKLSFKLSYSTFKKADKNRKTFGCLYGLDIEFSFTGYTVYLDEFSESGSRTITPKYERLLHEPLTEKEMNALQKELGETLLKHITFNTTKMGIL